MKRKAILALYLSLAILHDAQAQQNEIYVADPTIVVSHGKYYMSGTEDADEARGFCLYESTDLKKWTKGNRIIAPNESISGTKWFWAPQFIKARRGKWLAFYTADSQVAVAGASRIEGPYKRQWNGFVDLSENNIDPYLFVDEDGKCYLYHVRFDNGNYLWCAEFDMKRGRLKSSTLKKCFGITQEWERTAEQPVASVMEGPTVMKMDGKYYLFYSTNHFQSPDYAVGYATADSPYGPWTKAANNPVIHRSKLGMDGTGHGDVFTALDGNLYYVFHSHGKTGQAVPRTTHIIPLRSRIVDGGQREFYISPDELLTPTLSE